MYHALWEIVSRSKGLILKEDRVFGGNLFPTVTAGVRVKEEGVTRRPGVSEVYKHGVGAFNCPPKQM